MKFSAFFLSYAFQREGFMSIRSQEEVHVAARNPAQQQQQGRMRAATVGRPKTLRRLKLNIWEPFLPRGVVC